MNNEKSSSNHISKSSEQTHTVAPTTMNPGDITLNQMNHTNNNVSSNDSNEILILNENQQNVNIKDKSESIEEPTHSKMNSRKRPKYSYKNPKISQVIKTRQMKQKLAKLKRIPDSNPKWMKKLFLKMMLMKLVKT